MSLLSPSQSSNGGKQPSLFWKPYDFYDSLSDEFVCFICFTSSPSHTWSLTGAIGMKYFHILCFSVTKIKRYLVKENADCGVYPYKDLSQIWQDYMVKRSLVAKTDFWYLILWLEKGLYQSKFFRK